MATTGHESGLFDSPGLSDSGLHALGENLEAFRGYLTRVAGQELGPDLAGKVGASDLVQDTFLQARRKLATYRGRTPGEWMAWLERILRRRLANVRRQYRDTEMREVGREVRIDAAPAGDDTRVGPDPSLADTQCSPGEQAARRERGAALRAAIEALPPHYRTVVLGHHEEGLTFEELAARLDVSAEAARKLWGRALVRLREAMGPAHDPR